jgi:opacity protein-like surface antigen
MGILCKSQVLVYDFYKKCNMMPLNLVLMIMDNRPMNLKKLKIIPITLLLAFTTNSAFAGPDGSPFEGLYVGFTTTLNTFDTEAIYREVPNDNFPSNFSSISDSVSSNSYGAGIIAGYGLTYGPLYYGAEAAFIVDKGNTVYTDGANSIRVAKSNTFDINGRLGFLLGDKALLFGLVGYSGINLKSRGVNELRSENSTYNTRVTALRFGGGVEVAIMENIALRAEYTRSIGANSTYRDGSDEFTFKPKTSRIMLSAVLHMY